MKRKQENWDEIFDITEYKLDTLESLIQMIKDYSQKKLPSKKYRTNYPSKMKLLPDILEHLIKLNNMIGMKKLKTQIIDQILFFIQITDEPIMLHTVLEGPPGTGKTTLAEILAEIYSRLGIFKKVKFNIVKRSDLISEYLGGTTVKTLETLNRCKNGVMLIDEAYSLGSNGSNGSEDIYAKECLDTINQYLSENVDKIICIIAGYKKELDTCFFSLNPGLRRRFPWTFTVENYNSDELVEIFYKIIAEKEWETTCEKKDVLNLIHKNLYLFDGNGGDINSIIEKSIIISVRNNFGKPSSYTIGIKDFSEALNIYIINKTNNLNLSLPPPGMYN
jgi:SpoVK/Ycf46/Vps4 family AAA+-type ATPase